MIRLEIWGDYACFTRPEMKVERVSYDMITPSAARNILQAIYWHPGLEWVVDKIYVMNPIRFVSIRRNEVKEVVSAQKLKSALGGSEIPLYIDAQDQIVQRASLILKDVRYIIEAHFDMTDKASETDSPAKFSSIINRRIEKGQCFTQPYLGCREFPAAFQAYDSETIVTAYPQEERDLGYMLYDMDFSDPKNISPTFIRAKLIHGVLDLTEKEIVR